MTTVREQTFLQDFGNLFLPTVGDPSQLNPDPAAEAFARYLRAARKAAGLTRDALARQTSLAPALLMAVEIAAVPADTLTWTQLQRLAEALRADLQLFALLLERDLPAPDPAPLAERLRRDWDSLVAYLGTPARAWTTLALAVAALGSALVTALLALQSLGPPVRVTTLIETSAALSRRGLFGFTGPPSWSTAVWLNNTPLLLIIVLIPLLGWYALVRRDLSPRLIRWLHRRPLVLVNGTLSLLLAVTLVLSLHPPSTAQSPAPTPAVEQLSAASYARPEQPLGVERQTSILTMTAGRNVFDSAGGPRASRSVGSSLHRAAGLTAASDPLPEIVSDRTIAHEFVRAIPHRPSPYLASLILCFPVLMGVLQALMAFEIRRVGRLRQVFASWATEARRRD